MFRKPISFKQALVIVIALHAIVFLGLGFYSEVNSYYSKIEREKHKEFLISKKSTKQSDWFSEPLKVKVVAKPPTKTKYQKSFEELSKLNEKELEKELDRLFALN